MKPEKWAEGSFGQVNTTKYKITMSYWEEGVFLGRKGCGSNFHEWLTIFPVDFPYGKRQKSLQTVNIWPHGTLQPLLL